MGSISDFFNDEQVGELLLRHHLRVHVTVRGSREAVTGNLDKIDFVFPSGQPAARKLIQQLNREGRQNNKYRPFVSRIVLATYRDYAETLRQNGVATPQGDPAADHPYYYNLDLAKFFDLSRQKKSWDDLSAGASRVSNRNRVLAQTTDVCTSNGGATYLGMVASVAAKDPPTTDQQAVDLANTIKPLLRAQGLPIENPEIYFTPEGRGRAPIIVLYEHQYLAYQLRSTQLADDRVLLYPDPAFQTEPELIALTPDGDRLGKLLATDPDLRRRATELGLRVLDPAGSYAGKPLSQILDDHHPKLPSPAPVTATTATLPAEDLLEEMISIVGDCK